jgi:hypothetical protein
MKYRWWSKYRMYEFLYTFENQKHYGILGKMTALHDITLWAEFSLISSLLPSNFRSYLPFMVLEGSLRSLTFYHWSLFWVTLNQFTPSHDAVVVWDWGRSWKQVRTLSTCPDGESNRVTRFRLPPELIYSVKYEKREHYKIWNSLHSDHHFRNLIPVWWGERGSLVCCGTMLQAGKSVRFPTRSLDFFFNLHNPSSRTMALGSTQPLTEMNTRSLPGGKGWPVCKADNLTAICVSIVWKMLEPGHVAILWASTAY